MTESIRYGDTPAPAPTLFRSFWQAGFESACHINKAGVRLDMIAATHHDRCTSEDYARVRALGVRTVREAVRWHLVDKGGQYDFTSIEPLLAAARRWRMQVIWTLCHYGPPDGVDLRSPAFIHRFARYAAALARRIREESDEVPFYLPVNEISYYSWAAGEEGTMHPYLRGEGLVIKRQLLRGAIGAIEAIRQVDHRARIVHADPLIHVVPPTNRPDLARAAADRRAAQFEAWDMLAGHLDPALGGRPAYLDIIGANFYHTNQWEYPDRTIWWHRQPRDDRWVPLSLLLRELHDRYRRPVFISETSHFGKGRSRWLREITSEVTRARGSGVPVEGVCLYPILDRPDWEDPGHWHNSGLWDLTETSDGRLERRLNDEYAATLRQMQRFLPGDGVQSQPGGDEPRLPWRVRDG
jgi:beta-glucosidase/6-phospho-beta-glucosidase/beta-galactosidase